MLILAFDPAVHHVAWTLTEHGESAPEGFDLTEHGVICGDGSGWLSTIQALRQSWPVQLLAEIPTVIEGQHFKQKQVRKEDVRNVSMVAGALFGQFPHAVYAPTEPPGQWSRDPKVRRHNRIRGRLLTHVDWDDIWDFEIPPHAKRGLTPARVKEDLMDCIGMALWLAQDCPKRGL